MKDESIYGSCECGYSLSPVYFEERESIIRDGHLTWTNRYKKACSHLVCESCGKNYCVDNTFDGNWYTKGTK